uniref:Uncharacterized protein n=1 Tax=Rhizophora mucronata TaxID=61149 RepID=A0A2P2N0Y8_RHIMU
MRGLVYNNVVDWVIIPLRLDFSLLLFFF